MHPGSPISIFVILFLESIIAKLAFKSFAKIIRRQQKSLLAGKELKLKVKASDIFHCEPCIVDAIIHTHSLV